MPWSRLRTITLCWLSQDERGATAIEYGLISALAGLVLIPAAGSIGNKIDDRLSIIDTALAPTGVVITVSQDEAGCNALKMFGLDAAELCRNTLKETEPDEPSRASGLRLDRLP